MPYLSGIALTPSPLTYNKTLAPLVRQFLRRDLVILSRSVDMNESLYRRNRAFRGSKLKKTIELQGVAMNLHVQLFRVEELGRPSSAAPAEASPPQRRPPAE